MIAGEDRGEFDLLLNTLQAELRPVGLLEHVLVERMAVTLWRQRRLVKAESAGITLRESEKTGTVYLDLMKHFSASVKNGHIEAALDTVPNESRWQAMIKEVDDFDPAQENAVAKLEAQAPHAYMKLRSVARHAGKSVKDLMAEKDSDLAEFLSSWRSNLTRILKATQITRTFRDSRALPENTDILVRYQSGLDNELYKAMRALREAQTWRLASIDRVPAE